MRDFIALRQDTKARATAIPPPVLVPENCQRATVIFHAVETEPVPSSVGKERMHLDDIVRARAEADDAGDQEVGEGAVVVVTAATVLAVDPVAGHFVEVLADERFAVGVLAV